MDGGSGIAMDLQAELLGELLGGVGGSVHGGSLTCDAISVMQGQKRRLPDVPGDGAGAAQDTP